VHIRDNGIGMTPEDIPIALSKFGQVQSANKTQSGTGLGLPLSKELMLLHQGDLLLHSEAGKGTTVTVLLPAARVILTQQAA
jgi:two-component system cell cycle sensor histidine kinase PleC